ncbi:bacterioferritin [Thiorhodococcus drewsii AZ1]|uniref:Bacterioferritin n=1 Tax=Thiorhodococcus drewsii AZ1 TaxID=765913 RepID=G2DY36_9GAMM|nr:bacterioferritin [Thiorhodococcus drewsii]EGV32828.1 bacterioferritin [Thiorhodococcus drewsii AZ1]
MKGKPTVIAQLQKLLAGELAAIDQYFIHSRMYEDWGFHALFERIDHETQEEREHADKIIKRMLFLEATPDLSQRDALRVGTDVTSMLKNDLQLEYEVVDALKEAIAICEKEQDYQTREMLEVLLQDTEEDHAYWLERQLGLIDHLGMSNYLQSQLGAP